MSAKLNYDDLSIVSHSKETFFFNLTVLHIKFFLYFWKFAEKGMEFFLYFSSFFVMILNGTANFCKFFCNKNFICKKNNDPNLAHGVQDHLSPDEDYEST